MPIARLSVDVLIESGVSVTAAKLHAPALSDAADKFGINTQRRAAAFVGQCMHETAGLTEFEENLRYTSPQRIAEIFKSRVPSVSAALPLVRNAQALANRVYAGRYGNGDEASGDGWRYRGRGGGHLTFRANYRDAGLALGRPYEAEPGLVAQPADAAMTFAWFWSNRGCNEMADAWNLRGITKAINPGMAGYESRVELSNKALQAMAS